MNPVLLDGGRLRARLVDGGPYAALDVVTVTGSTNTDLAAAASRGAADRTVLIAEEQEAGRGRMQRQWTSPRGRGLFVSVLLRPDVPQSAVSWVPLIAGVALAETVQRTTGVRASLKWPNDLLLGSGDEWLKAAGILGEAVAGPDGLALVLGMGVNLLQQRDELPRGAGGLPATSLVAEGGEVDREEFAVALLTAFAAVDDRWRAASGDVVRSGLLDRYRQLCSTVGQQVRVELGPDEQLRGVATGIDVEGRLMVRAESGLTTAVSAGDVVHVRRA
ncbi:BirA family transcriptional regulator, biotin operon repressor / biotin-[acetyl-CoA-carboxylase] ligase [Saccharopolyspora kobensis]|uniref:biotin--[biotin carboxyl-carrier protein] ligase n=2 Tax=Saccharopolyspora kobensis TaxID=146035 RepID=A0A1H6EBT4_9PSEU|nr:biotin--[acetyl-CoA-carboxylase] ligase [Saccharopolyspora kobensis]SEG94406.1 BirA family transcriptional regulator, biotin operon repressor / biotin-[acetyl-CoA-carboxylase] ligase [Saccharopolyspora kobensis]SFD65236.1 BirA family transcriptional regulator, biotin operon repressor / biotin-[acetyl-CoA-carboxylase] ligase [Saccharopolyspora kobensis]